MTGGSGNGDYLDSTELLVPGSGSWRLATGLLPRPMYHMGVATVANILYLTGRIVIMILITIVMACIKLYPGGLDSNNGYGGRYDEILEFRPDTEDWILAGHMTKARGGHAVSTINFEDVQEYCIEVKNLL